MPVIGVQPNANPLSKVGFDKLYMSKGEVVSVAVGAEQTMLSTNGPGCVKSLWMATGGGPGPSLDSRIRIYYDGSSTPAVDQDIGTLFATHFGATGSHSTTHMHVEPRDGTGNYNHGWMITFPMPFGTSIRVTYYSPSSSTTTADIYWMITYALYNSDRANGMRLRSQGRRYALDPVTVTATQTFNKAVITGGPGALLWHSYVGGVGASNLTWMERNMIIQVDGETTPQIQGSGTEDWFDSAWYFNGWKDYNTSFHSYVATDLPASPNQYVVGMATDFLSKWGGVPFSSSCTFTLGTESVCTTGHTFSYSILYYQ